MFYFIYIGIYVYFYHQDQNHFECTTVEAFSNSRLFNCIACLFIRNGNCRSSCVCQAGEHYKKYVLVLFAKLHKTKKAENGGSFLTQK